MKDKQIYEIEHCNDCPFMQNDYDDWAIGNDTIISCNLYKFIKKQFIVINSYKSSSYRYDKKTDRPNWCILNKNELIFKIKE